MSKLIKPTPEEVAAYAESRGFPLDPEEFIDYYASQGWKKKNGRPLEDWQAAVRTWERSWRKQTGNLQTSPEMDNLVTDLTREVSESEARGLLAGLFPETP